MKEIYKLLNPKSVVLIGASRKEGSVGYVTLKNLILAGYKGTIYVVNPTAESILGYKCYKKISDLEEVPDVACILVPAAYVPQVLKESAIKGIKVSIIISAGFKESGPEGEKLEKEVEKISKEFGIRVLGPNCIGVINTDPNVRFTTNFASDMPKEGNISLISQSGAICVSILDFAKSRGIGFSKVISMGNRVDIDEVELLEYLGEDEKTKVILMYIEELKRGREFIEVAKNVSKKKPILALKAGVSPEGARAVSSHTGSLAGEPVVYRAVFRQAGVIEVQSPLELFEYASLLASQPYPKGNRVGIITNAGGPGIVATDSLIESGLVVNELSDSTKNNIRPFVSPHASLKNPVDLLAEADAEKFEVAIKALYNDKNIDAIYFLMAPQRMIDIEKVAEVISKYANKKEKTFVTVLMGVVDVEKGAEVLRKEGVPFYRFPDVAAKSLSIMLRYSNFIKKRKETYKDFSFPSNLKDFLKPETDTGFIDLDICFKVLEEAGFNVVPWFKVESEDDLLEGAKKLGFPLVLKIASGEVVHKMDAGGVILNIEDEENLFKAYESLKSRFKRKIKKFKKAVLQKMVKESHKEIIIGLKKDDRFGYLLLFGLGGIFVEIFKDVTFRLVPVSVEETEEMLREIKFYPLLKGFRGEKESDLEKIKEFILRVSSFAEFMGEIKEMDLNPIFVFEKGKGALIADARIRV
ncbi:MAG: acetate--CoA ligase family protein [Candidatus Hydrothermales bacterium]